MGCRSIAAVTCSLLFAVSTAAQYMVRPTLVPTSDVGRRVTLQLIPQPSSPSLDSERIGLGTDGACTAPLVAPAEAVVGNSLSVTLTSEASFTLYLCREVSGSRLSPVAIAGGSVYTIAQGSLFTKSAVVGDTVELRVFGGTAERGRFFLADSEDACSFIPGAMATPVLCAVGDGGLSPDNTWGCTAVLSAQRFSNGSFQLCYELEKSRAGGTDKYRGPVTSSTAPHDITLKRYAVEPSQGFAGVDPLPQITAQTPCVDDAVFAVSGADCNVPDKADKIAFGCVGNVLAAVPSWHPAAPGAHTFCMTPNIPALPSGASLRASPGASISVGSLAAFKRPLVSFDEPLRLGIENEIRVSDLPSDASVALAVNSDCTDVRHSWTAGTTKATFTPTAAFAANMFVCLRLQGRPQRFRAVRTEAFRIRHGPVFADEAFELQMDPGLTTGSRVNVVAGPPTTPCGSPDSSWLVVPALPVDEWFKTTMTLSSVGQHVICAEVGGSKETLGVGVLQSYRRASSDDTSLVSGLQNAIIILKMFRGAKVSVAMQCSKPSTVLVGLQTTVGPSDVVDPQWTWTFGVSPAVALANYELCVEYPASPSPVAVRVSDVSVVQLAHNREYCVTSAATRLTFTNGGTSMYMSKAACGVPASTEPILSVDAGSAVVDCGLLTEATYNVCLRVVPASGGSSVYMRTGTLNVLAPYTVNWKESWAPVADLPVHATVTHPAVAVGRLALVPSNTAGPSACDDVAKEDVIDALPFVIPRGGHDLCVEVPVGGSFLFATTATGKPLEAKTKSFFVGSVADIWTNLGEVSGATYFFATNCSVGVKFEVTHLGLVATTVPPRDDYHLCLQLRPFPSVAESVGTVTVYPAIQAVLPEVVRRNVGFDVTFTANPRVPAAVYVGEGAGPCLLSTDSVSPLFEGPGDTVAHLTGLTKRAQDYRICALAPGSAGAAWVATVTPVSFLSPFELPFGKHVNVFAGHKTGSTREGRVAYNKKCTDSSVVGVLGSLGVGPDGYVIIPAPTESDLTSHAAFYCERDGFAWVFKGDINFVPSFTVQGQQPFKPGVLNNIRISPPSMDRNSFLSRSPDCATNDGLLTEPVFPRFDDTGVFYVCVQSTVGGSWYTILPEGRVVFSVFSVAPQHLFDGAENFIELMPKLADVVAPAKNGGFLSPDVLCSVPQGPLFFDKESVVPRDDITGNAFLCLRAKNGLVPVAKLTIWESPHAELKTPIIHGAPVCFLPGVSGSHYNLTVEQSAHVVPVGSRCDDFGVAVGTTNLVLSGTGTCVSTAGTPYGTALTLCIQAPTIYSAALTFTPTAVSMDPPSLTAGRREYSFTVLPEKAGAHRLHPGRYAFATEVATCATERLGPFTTRPDGTILGGSIRQLTLPNGTHVKSGKLVLCMLYPVTGSWEGVFATSISVQYYYGLSSTVFRAGATAEVAATKDLDASNVRGFSATGDCNAPENGTEGMPTYFVAGNSITIVPPGAHDARFVACGFVPWNNTVVAFTEIHFVDDIIVQPSSIVACVGRMMSFYPAARFEPATSDPTSSAYLADRPCCTSANFASGQAVPAELRVAALGEPPGAFVRVPRAEFISRAENTSDTVSMHLCVSNVALQSCLHAGRVTVSFVEGQCVEATGESAPRGIFGSRPVPQSANALAIALIVLTFLCVIMCLVAMCVLFLWYRRRRQIPCDVEEQTNGWDRLVSRGELSVPPKGASLHSALRMPIDMDLNNCIDDPVEIIDVMLAAETERRQIAQAAEFSRHRLLADFNAATHELLARIEADERDAADHIAHEFWFRERINFADIEAEARDVVTALQDEERLKLLADDAAEFDALVVAAAQCLEEAVEQEQRATSRKRKLLEASTAMMQHIDDAALLRDVSPSRVPDGAAATDNQAAHPYESVERRRSIVESRLQSEPAASPLPRPWYSSGGAAAATPPTVLPGTVVSPPKTSPVAGVEKAVAGHLLSTLTPGGPSAAGSSHPSGIDAVTRAVNPLSESPQPAVPQLQGASSPEQSSRLDTHTPIPAGESTALPVPGFSRRAKLAPLRHGGRL